MLSEKLKMETKALCCCLLALVGLLMMSDVTAKSENNKYVQGRPIPPPWQTKTASGKRMFKVSKIAECLVLLISLFEKSQDIK